MDASISQMPDQFAAAGIPLDSPAPPEVGSDAAPPVPDDPFADLVPDNKKSAPVGANPFEDLVPEKNRKAVASTNPFEDLVPKEVTSTATDKANAFTGPLNKMILAPVRAGAYGMNKLLTATGIQPMDNPDIENMLKHNFYPDVPNTFGTRVAGKAGEMAGDTALMMGTMGAYAPEMMAGKAADMALPRIGGAVQDTMKTYAAKPASLMADLAIGAPAAGAGAEAGREATKGTPYEALGETAGGVLGGGITATPSILGKYWKYGIYPNMVKFPYQVAKGSILSHVPDSVLESNNPVLKVVKTAKDNYTDQMNQRALPAAAKMYSQIVTPEAGQQLQEAQRLRGIMNNFNPTMAEATGIPSLAATQKGVEAGASGNILDKMVARKQASEAGIRAFSDQNAPPVSDADITGAVQRRVDQAARPVANQAQSVQSLREGVADTLPTVNKYDSGNYLRDRQEALRVEKQKEMSDLAQDSGLNDARKLPIKVEAMQTAVANALPPGVSAKTASLALKASPTMKLINGLDVQEPLSFADAKFYMENLGQEARQAAKVGDMNSARMISAARDNIDKHLVDEWAPSLQMGDKYKAFRNIYRSEYVDRFNSGTAQDVGAVSGDQRYRTSNEDVAGNYFAPGDVTAAKDFNKTFAGDPKAMEAVQAHVMDDIRQKTVTDGVVDPKKLDKWVAANPQISEFPGLQKQVSDMKTLNESLAQRQATLNGRQQTVEDSNLAQMLKNKNVNVDGLLQDHAAFKRVMGGATDDEKASMARQLWQRANQGAAEDPAAMKKFLTDHADILPTVLGEDHIDALNNIQKAWEMNARAPTPTGRPVNPSTAGFNIKSLTGSSPQTLLSRAFAVESGRTGWKYTLGDLIARAGYNLNSRQAQSMMDRAMYDKDFAKQLSDFVGADKITSVKLRKFKAATLATGLSGLEDQQQDTSPRQGYAEGGIIGRFSQE